MFELCKSLGYVHPSDMLAELSASELNDWWDYYRAEPWGETRQDARASWQVALIGSIFGSASIDSACAVPHFVSEIYSAPEMDEETKETMRRIRGNRSNHLNSAGRADGGTP